MRIDGELNELAWKESVPGTGFIEWRPNAGKLEDSTTWILKNGRRKGRSIQITISNFLFSAIELYSTSVASLS